MYRLAAKEHRMRTSLLSRLALVLLVVLAGSLVAAAQAAPAAQPPQPEQSTPPARIAVVHAAPFAADSTVTVVVNDAILLDDNFQFGEAISYITVPAATYKVEIFAGSITLEESAAATPALSENLTLAAGTDYTVAAIGTNTAAFPLDLLLLDDTTDAPGSGTAKVRVVHVAPFAPTPAETAVDVIPDAGGPSLIAPSLEPFIYGEFTTFAALPSGVSFDLQVVADGTTSPALIDLDPITLDPGQIITAFAIGGANGYGPEVLLLPFVEDSPAQVRLVHAAPFSSTATTVTVALNGQVVTNSLDYRDVTPYKRVASGIYTATVFAGSAATGTPAITAPLVLQGGEKYTVVAIGTNTATYPLKLVVLNDDQTPAASATARLRVLHAAPFAASTSATAVDVVAQNGTPIPGLSNILYEELRSNITVPSGTPIDVKIVPTGQPSGTPIVDPAALTLNASGAYTVIAIGGANGQPGDVLLLDDLAEAFYLYAPLAAK
jgi:hypothetical protein